MIEDIRKTALAHAMELARLRCGGEASSIVKDASVFEAYLTGAIVSPINECSGSIEPLNNLSSGNLAVLNGNGGKVFPVCVSQGSGYNMNKTFTSCDIPNCTHKNNSSQKENNCGQELPTPGHTETVVPGGGAVTEPGTHGRTDGGA